MKVCDKCSKKGELKEVKIGNKKYDLCKVCIIKVINFIETKKEKNFLEKIGDNFGTNY